jgi:hypothetical protein
MRKNIITLITFLGGILYAAIWTTILYFSFTHRQIGYGDDVLLFTVMFICFYLFGVYTTAIIFRLLSKRERYIVPSALLYGSIIGLVLSLLIILAIVFSGTFAEWAKTYGGYSGLMILLGIWLLSQLVWIRNLCRFETNKDTSLRRFIIKIAIVLLINLTLLLVVCINDFPGVSAPIVVRQQWAYKEFRNYPEVVNSVKNEKQIIEKVGQIIFVAPTMGRNVIIVQGGTSIPTSLYTVEVAGEKGTGIAYIESGTGGSVLGICFEYQGKKTELRRLSDRICGN